MNNYYVKLAIENNFKPTITLTKEELLATKMVLYKNLLDIINSQSSITNNLNDIITVLTPSAQTKIIDLKNNFLSYNKIIFFLKKNEYNNILGVNESVIDTVMQYYNTTDSITKFSINSFDISMYNTSDSSAYNYLYKLHTNVFIPIIKYYNSIYNINISNMKIISSEVSDNTGKVILFCIDDINPIQILADIKSKKISIPYYSIEYISPYIKIINI